MHDYLEKDELMLAIIAGENSEISYDHSELINILKKYKNFKIIGTARADVGTEYSG